MYFVTLNWAVSKFQIDRDIFVANRKVFSNVGPMYSETLKSSCTLCFNNQNYVLEYVCIGTCRCNLHPESSFIYLGGEPDS